MTTNVPDIQITSSGITVPTEADILSGVQADLNSAFGGNLNPSLNTPQGQIASSESAIIANKNAQFANLASMCDPDYATGRFQDAIGKYYFMTRKPATATTTQVTCYGATNTPIPVGAKCIDSLGNIYICTTAGVIPSGGSVVLTFACQTLGPIVLALNDLIIYQSIDGWASVTNTVGVLGTNVESRSDFEYRRKNSVAINAQGMIAAVQAAVFSVAGVTDVYAYENSTGSPITIGSTSFPMVAHSVVVSVSGSYVSADIAAAIVRSKAPGCDMNGATSAIVEDSVNYSPPYPQYAIKYQQAAALPIKFLVQIQNNALLPSNVSQQIKDAIIAAFSGSDGGQRARIGATVYSSRYYSGIASISQYINILALYVGTGGGAPSATSVAVGIDQAPTIQSSDISVSLI